MKHFIYFLFMSYFVFNSFSSLWAGEVTGLKMFNAGDPAVAADVNDNFTAVKKAVDDNNTSKQKRVSGACADGSSIRIINEDGSVVCEPDNIGLYAMPGIEWSNISVSNIDVRTAAVNVGTVELDVPAAGYVVVRFDGRAFPEVGDRIVLAASDTSGYWGANDGTTTVFGESGDTYGGKNFSHTRVYPVPSSGSYTFYAVAQNYVQTGGDGFTSVYATLTAQYFPVKY